MGISFEVKQLSNRNPEIGDIRRQVIADKENGQTLTRDNTVQTTYGLIFREDRDMIGHPQLTNLNGHFRLMVPSNLIFNDNTANDYPRVAEQCKVHELNIDNDPELEVVIETKVGLIIVNQIETQASNTQTTVFGDIPDSFDTAVQLSMGGGGGMGLAPAYLDTPLY